MPQDICLKVRLLNNLKRYHTGHHNAIPSRILEMQFSVVGSTIRRAVLRLRLEGHPICSDQSGYFFASTSYELEATIRQYEGRRRNASVVCNALNHALVSFPDTGQQRL